MGDAGFIRGEEAVRAVCEFVAKDANAKHLAFDAEYKGKFASLFFKGWAGDFFIDFSDFNIEIGFKDVEIIFYSEKTKLRRLGSEDTEGYVIYDDDLSVMPAREQVRIISEILCIFAYANDVELSCESVLRRLPEPAWYNIYNYNVLLWKDGVEPYEKRIGNIRFRVEADSEALRRERIEQADRNEPETFLMPFGQIVGKDYTRALFERCLREPGEAECGLLTGGRASMSLCDRLMADANAKYLTFDPVHDEDRSTLHLRGRDGDFRVEFLPLRMRVLFKGVAFEFYGGGPPEGAWGEGCGARVVYSGDMSARSRTEQLEIIGDVVSALAGADSIEVEDVGLPCENAENPCCYSVRLAKEDAEPREKRVGNIAFHIGPAPSSVQEAPILDGVLSGREVEGLLWEPGATADLCARLSEGPSAKYLTLDLDLGEGGSTLHLRGREGGFSVGLSSAGALVSLKGVRIALEAPGALSGELDADCRGSLPDGSLSNQVATVAEAVFLMADADSVEVAGPRFVVLGKRFAEPGEAVVGDVTFRVERDGRPFR